MFNHHQDAQGKDHHPNAQGNNHHQDAQGKDHHDVFNQNDDQDTHDDVDHNKDMQKLARHSGWHGHQNDDDHHHHNSDIFLIALVVFTQSNVCLGKLDVVDMLNKTWCPVSKHIIQNMPVPILIMALAYNQAELELAQEYNAHYSPYY